MSSHGESMLCKVSNSVLSFIYCLRSVRRVKITRNNSFAGGISLLCNILLNIDLLSLQVPTGDRVEGSCKRDFRRLQLLLYGFSKDPKLMLKQDV